MRTRSSARIADAADTLSADVQRIDRSSYSSSKRARTGPTRTTRHIAAADGQNFKSNEPFTPSRPEQEVQIAAPADRHDSIPNHAIESSAPFDVPVSESDTALTGALWEAQHIFSSKGINAFRDFMENIPSHKGLQLSKTKAIFWVAWLRAELDAGEWVQFDDLMLRARSEVLSDRFRASRYAAQQSKRMPVADSEASRLEASIAPLQAAASRLRSQEEAVREVLETSVSSPIMMSQPGSSCEIAVSSTLEAMAGRPYTNQPPRSITLPAPRALDTDFGEISRKKATKLLASTGVGKKSRRK